MEIDPFGDGKGRTARLLMNLMLLRDGYPPVAVRPEDRGEFLASLEEASNTHDTGRLQRLLHARLAETLDAYVGLFHEAEAGAQAALTRKNERRRDGGR